MLARTHAVKQRQAHRQNGSNIQQRAHHSFSFSRRAFSRVALTLAASAAALPFLGGRPRPRVAVPPPPLPLPPSSESSSSSAHHPCNKRAKSGRALCRRQNGQPATAQTNVHTTAPAPTSRPDAAASADDRGPLQQLFAASRQHPPAAAISSSRSRLVPLPLAASPGSGTSPEMQVAKPAEGPPIRHCGRWNSQGRGWQSAGARAATSEAGCSCGLAAAAAAGAVRAIGRAARLTAPHLQRLVIQVDQQAILQQVEVATGAARARGRRGPAKVHDCRWERAGGRDGRDEGRRAERTQGPCLARPAQLGQRACKQGSQALGLAGWALKWPPVTCSWPMQWGDQSHFEQGAQTQGASGLAWPQRDAGIGSKPAGGMSQQ